MSVSLPDTKHPWSFKVPFVMVVRTALALDRVYALYTLWALVAYVLGFGFHLLSHPHSRIVSVLYYIALMPIVSGPWAFVWFLVMFFKDDNPEKMRKFTYYILVFITISAFALSVAIIRRRIWNPHHLGAGLILTIGFLLILVCMSQVYIFSYAIGRYLMNLRDYSTRGYPEPVEMRKAIRAAALRLAAGKG